MPKMNAKLAARFGHINFNPAALAVSAKPPKPQANERQIDHSAEMNKVILANVGRRKRTKSRVVIEDDDETVSSFGNH